MASEPSMRVLARGEKLAPAVAGDRAVDKPAARGRLEIDADLAALLALRRGLVFGFGFRDLLLRSRAVGDDGRRQQRQAAGRAAQHGAARDRPIEAYCRHPDHLATSASCAFGTCHSTMW